MRRATQIPVYNRIEARINIVRCCRCGERTNALTPQSPALSGWHIARWPARPELQGKLYCPGCARHIGKAAPPREQMRVCARCHVARPLSSFAPVDRTGKRATLKCCSACRANDRATHAEKRHA